MLPSVDSRLAWRVILLRISTASPVSVLLWMVLRNFLPPASGRTFRHTKMGKRERDRGWCKVGRLHLMAKSDYPRDTFDRTGWSRRGTTSTTPNPLNHSALLHLLHRDPLCVVSRTCTWAALFATLGSRRNDGASTLHLLTSTVCPPQPQWSKMTADSPH